MTASAAHCQADAVKFQKRTIHELLTREALDRPYLHANSLGATYGEHRQHLEFGLQPYISCRAVAQACRVDFFATAFDEKSADFLMEVDVPAIKVHSGGLTDEPLLTHVASLGVPVIVTTTHFGTKVCAERSRRAQDMGGAMVMVMPPYHGATIRVSEAQVYEFYARLSDAIGIPIMIQDAPVAGTPLSAAFGRHDQAISGNPARTLSSVIG